MPTQTFEIEAETLEQARNVLKSKIPAGLFVQSEEVISTGKVHVSRGEGGTYEKAAADAKAKIPDGSAQLGIKEVEKAKKRTTNIDADSEKDAMKSKDIVKIAGETVKSAHLLTPAKNGFLGIGKKSAQYEVTLEKPFIVEITHKQKAKIRATVGDQIATWQALITTLKGVETNPENKKIMDEFPYHVFFLVTSNKLNDPAYFEKIPFGPVTQEQIESARNYVENPHMPVMMSMFGSGFDPERYSIKTDGHVYRKANIVVDSAIASVADYLKGRGNFNMNDDAGISRCAYDAIVHYSLLGPVAFFFALPYFDKVKESKNIVLEEIQVSQYKGTEALLVEMYDRLGEGGMIRETDVISLAYMKLK